MKKRKKIGGERGIRTPEPSAQWFQDHRIDHSAISPHERENLYIKDT